MIRMLMIGYLQGIRSERRLVEEVHLNLAYRWFCRLGLDGRVPERSTFSKNRHGRFAEGDLFRTVFEDVVRRCAAAGIVPGESAAVDGSFILADASPSRRVVGNEQPERWGDLEVVTRPVREYLSALDAAAPPAADEPRKGAPKYLSATDPAAAWSNKHGPGRFGYETNYLVDTAYGVIVDVEATPARLSQEIVAAKAMLAMVGFEPLYGCLTRRRVTKFGSWQPRPCSGPWPSSAARSRCCLPISSSILVCAGSSCAG